jgi:2-amino-4-hydroxy-6-hydroxymethyldihydropteridine diphosphokinase
VSSAPDPVSSRGAAHAPDHASVDAPDAASDDGQTAIAFVALGANLGDRLGTLRAAVAALASIPRVSLLAASSAWDTAPVGPPDQPRYLNAAVALRTSRSPRELLAELLEIEKRFGRDRDGSRWTARTLDLDIILFGNAIVSEGDLAVPHPRFRERAFVLLPLAEIAGNARDPVTGESVESLLRACPGRADAVLVEQLAGPVD